jgi:hypothetical protein
MNVTQPCIRMRLICARSLISIPGVYIDGHERADIVRDRRKFLAEMEAYEPRFYVYEGEQMEIKKPPAAGVKPLVLVVHDESVFAAHDGKKRVWCEETKQRILPKGEGHGIMASQFLCECHGVMRITKEQQQQHGLKFAEVAATLEIGKNADGYWRCENLVEQVKERLVPIFRILHPHDEALIAFDNSSNHHAFAPDALRSQALNLTDGGKNCLSLRSTSFVGQDGQMVVQCMQSAAGVQKGVKTILQERGLWPARNPPKLPEARKLLDAQPDFAAQKDWLGETLGGSSGFNIIYFPKFHCELNHIELYWAGAKRYARAHCNYRFENLRKVVPDALNSVQLAHIRRNARHCFRYMDAYRERNGRTLSTEQVKYAMQHYSSHRKVPLSYFDEGVPTTRPPAETAARSSSSSVSTVAADSTPVRAASADATGAALGQYVPGFSLPSLGPPLPPRPFGLVGGLLRHSSTPIPVPAAAILPPSLVPPTPTSASHAPNQ